MFALINFNQRNKIKIFTRKCVTALLKMGNYQEARVTLTNTKLNKLKSDAKNKTGRILKKIRQNVKIKNCHMNYF